MEILSEQTNKNKKPKGRLAVSSWKGFNAWSAKICLDPRAVQLLWPGIHPTDTLVPCGSVCFEGKREIKEVWYC